jgi:Na+-translocating ferredoxin:NAD+ oxidoreductase RnfA subunit
MLPPLAEIVEGKALLESVVYSLGAAIGLSIAFSTALWGATRAGEARRDDRPALALAAGAVMVVGLIACGAAVVLGVIVMTSK